MSVLDAVERRVGPRVDASVKPAVRWSLGHLVPSTVMRVAARRGDLQGQLIEASRVGDPFPLLERVRAEGPLYRSRYAWMATGMAEVREVLSSNDFHVGFDPSALSGPVGRAFAWASTGRPIGPIDPPSLLAVDPPDHTRYRRLVTRVFSVRAVEKLRARTEQIAAELLDALDPSRPVELVQAYCTLLPVTVIAEILGVPASEQERVLAFGEAAAPSLDMGLSWRRFRSVEGALAGFEQWLGEHLQRLALEPGDDLLSQLVAARDDGVGLTETELKATAGLVLAAGFETTVNLLGNGVALLDAHPEQRRRLVDEPDLWPNAVDEVLRYDPPVLLTGRTSSRDVTVGGQHVGAGSLVTTVLAAANRDPAVFDDPARFDVARANAKDHVSFSAGRHFCLGAALARMEGEVGLRRLFERYPSLRVLPGGRRRDTRILRGYATLPVDLGATG